MGGGRLARRAPLLAVCLAGGALRFATLGQQSFWLDEAATGRLMRMGLGGMLRALPDGESTPPVYYVLAWVWTRAFGTSEVGIRSLSALVGTLTVPVVYLAAARLLDRRAGLAAAALAAFSPLLVWYSQEARSYAVLVALSAASLWALSAALESGAAQRWLAAWAAAAALALATHNFAVFVILPEAVWLARSLGRRAAPAVGAVGLVGAVLAPLALHQRAQGGAAFIAASPLGTRLAQAAKQLVVGYDAPGELALTLVGAGLVLGLLGLLARGAAGPARGRALGLVGVAGAGVGLPVGLAVVGLDYVITRNLIAAWVPAAIALSAGVSLRAGARAGPPLVAGLCAVGLAVTTGVALDGRYERDDWRAAAGTLAGPGASALVVTPSSGRVPLAYYLPASRPLPATGAPVTWVEVIGLGARGVGAPVRSPPIPAAPPALAGFDAPVAVRRATFTVLRYRASGAPVVVTPGALAPLALGAGAGGPAMILTASPTKRVVSSRHQSNH
ncbi:MAG: mannosyltransferase [Solirubrobacteraceae bacterium]|nr:mannosyltransferase [Solirubrobacteraceae bacterium]